MNTLSGTLHLALFGKQRIIFCSDSRGHSESGPIDDEFQKLFQAGKRTLCATSGVLMLPPDLYVSSVIQSICGDNSFIDSPRELLYAIRDEMHGPLSMLCEANPLPDLPSIFSVISVLRVRTGEIDLLDLDFPIVMNDGIRMLGEPVIKSHLEGALPRGPFVYHHSRGDCLPHYVTNPDTAFDLIVPVAGGHLKDKLFSDEEVLLEIDSIFEAVTAANKSCRDEVGGPIDVAAIDSVGFRWLRKKPIVL
jgi:hypothetical protein